MSAVSIFFIIVAIVTIVVIVLSGWVIVSIVRLIASALTQLFAPHRAAHAKQLGAIHGNGNGSSGGVQCGNSACMAHNPADAKFCRRCGRGLPAAARVQVRRAAVW